MGTEASLFGPDLPEGLAYRDDFITIDEEQALVDEIQHIEFQNFEMRGAVARRRVAFFGLAYDASRDTLGPVPEFLGTVRNRAAAWAGIAPEAFAMALINEYRPGAPIGWHRDAPQYGIVAGISLLSPCRMKLRPYVSPKDLQARPGLVRRTTHEITLQPRSAYLLTGASRSRFEHSIPAVSALRHSVTFRTLRR